jgi:transcriptional regulator with PAS, ATPase and Fis domain
MSYDFPGNIRELENLIEHAFVMCRGEEIIIDHLPKEFRETVATPPEIPRVSLQSRFKDKEAEIIKDALERNRGHRGKTAKELGINPSTLWRKMKRLGISEN